MRWIILMRVSSPLYYLLRSAPMASFYVFMAGVRATSQAKIFTAEV